MREGHTNCKKLVYAYLTYERNRIIFITVLHNAVINKWRQY